VKFHLDKAHAEKKRHQFFLVLPLPVAFGLQPAVSLVV